MGQFVTLPLDEGLRGGYEPPRTLAGALAAQAKQLLGVWAPALTTSPRMRRKVLGVRALPNGRAGPAGAGV
jgi:hypothetical protein